MVNQKIIIVGGSGLLGRALSKKLVEENFNVTIFSRFPEKRSKAMPGVQVKKWDSADIKSLSVELSSADVVINLAGESIAGKNIFNMRWTEKRKEKILSSRITVGEALVEAVSLSAHKPRLFIQSSAIGYYGPSKIRNLNENSPPGVDFLAKVTQDWEKSTDKIEDLGIHRVTLRTGLVLSKEGGLLQTLKLPFLFFVGGKIGSGNQYMSWIHINDWVNAVLHLTTTNNTEGIYNLTAPNPESNESFGKKLGKAMQRPSVFPTPGIALSAFLGEAATLALDGQSVFPKRLVENGFIFSYEYLGDALSNLFEKSRMFTNSFRVSSNLKSVSDFHKNTSVLKRLTPFPIIVQFHHVEPIKKSSKAIFTLWFGPIPVKWEAEHYDINEIFGFSDRQLTGPFESWKHRHIFQSSNNNETMVYDEIEFVLGRGLFNYIISRFMALTLPILFAFRAWRTKRDLETSGASL